MTITQDKFKIIIVDDDINYVEPQKDLAYSKFDLELVHFTNWEEAESELVGNFSSYEAIIIDGKGQLTKDSKMEDESHLSVAINWLKEQKGRGLIIPIFINTGFHEELTKYYRIDQDIVGIFKKGENQTLQLFEAVKSTINGKDERKIKLMYKDVFFIFNDHYLPSQKQNLLMQALLAIQNSRCTKSDFNAVREILEEVYIKLQSLGKLDNKYFNGDRPILELCCFYLIGKEVITPNWRDKLIGDPIFPSHIGWTATGVKSVTSVLSHAYDHEFTHYALKNVTFGIMEVLVWLKSYIDSIKP